MESKISVIIISYNCAEYISEAIESCLSQSYKNIEIVIGDDGSTDTSNQIIVDYTDRYPTIIKHYVMSRPQDDTDIIPSIRVSDNIKQALHYVTGDYICLLSADDYYADKSLFEKEIAFLTKNNHCLSVACGHRKQWPNGKCIEALPPQNINSLFWSGAYLHISCFLMKIDVFKDAFFLPRFCDDTGLLYSLIASGKCKGIPLVGFVYRQREGSIVHKADKLELALLELLLYQDILNVGAMPISSLSRFAWPLNYVFSHRKELQNLQYVKYVNESSKLRMNIIKDMMEYEHKSFGDKCRINVYCLLGKILAFFTRITRKIYYYGEKLLNGR